MEYYRDLHSYLVIVREFIIAHLEIVEFKITYKFNDHQSKKKKNAPPKSPGNVLHKYICA